MFVNQFKCVFWERKKIRQYIIAKAILIYLIANTKFAQQFLRIGRSTRNEI